MELWYLGSVLDFDFVLPLSWDLKVYPEAMLAAVSLHNKKERGLGGHTGQDLKL